MVAAATERIADVSGGAAGATEGIADATERNGCMTERIVNAMVRFALAAADVAVLSTMVAAILVERVV